MYLHDLVRTITLEILKELQGRNDKLCTMVLADNTPKTVAKVHEVLGNNLILVFSGETAVEGKVPQRYIMPYLSCSDMASLAAGKAYDTYTATALRLLLEGKEIEVLEFEYKAYVETAPFALYNLYASHETTLAGYGMKAHVPTPPGSVRFRESLVTEQAVTRAHEKGASTLVVSKEALVTPLASETARALNITILKQL